MGIVTARDKLTIQWTADDMERIVEDFAARGTEAARTFYDLGKDARDWQVQLAQEDVRRRDGRISPVLYRPFDRRFTYYTGKSRGFICMPRPKVMRHMLAGENVALMSCRQSIGNGWKHLLATRLITDDSMVSNRTRERGYLSPFTFIRGLEVQIHYCSAAGPRARTAARQIWTRGSSSRLQPPPNCDSSATAAAI